VSFDLAARAKALPSPSHNAVYVEWPTLHIGHSRSLEPWDVITPAGFFVAGATFQTQPFRRPAIAYRPDRLGD
jgi:hypothetical protein